MAYQGIHRGLLPATSNIASIRIVNPPAVIYLFMPVAAFTADPLWGVVLVAIFNLAAVVLTYLFVRRYYGRFAGTIAALLYGTASRPLYYSRFIWQQNIIAPFVVLFLFALFQGVVERRKGWLFPALLLLGILVQLHETTGLLIVPFLVALLLAPGTLRWRDLALALVALFIIFSTYLVWVISTRLADLNTILHLSKHSAHLDSLAISYYELFLFPYDRSPTSPHTLVYTFVPLLDWLHRILLPLLLGSFAFALIAAFRSQNTNLTKDSRTNISTKRSLPGSLIPSLRQWWTDFRGLPGRCGLALLLTWQIVPLLVFLRHSVPIYPYYLLMFMPGPFILIAILISRGIAWPGGESERYRAIVRYAVYSLVCFLVISQFTGVVASLIDEASGNNKHSYAYNTLGSLQNALTEADRLAQQRHLNHLYIATDHFTQASLGYLSAQLRTPTTLFDSSQCLVLPDPADGPAVFLVGPYDRLTTVLLNRFTSAALIDQPQRLGSAPFQLYVVAPAAIAGQKPSSLEDFLKNLQLINPVVSSTIFNNSTLLVTRWRLLRSEQPGYRTSYSYAMMALLNGNGTAGQHVQAQCISTAMRAGDQLLVTFDRPVASSLPASVTVQAQYFTTRPYNLPFGPFLLETIKDSSTPAMKLETARGMTNITIPLSP